jgi:anti-sigma B factor antagonist
MDGYDMEELLTPISVTADASRHHALVLHVRGEIDISTAGAIRREWAELISARQPGHDVAVIDLSAVDFFGSSGLSALVECRHAADELGLTLRVITAGPAVMRPLEGTGLVDCFDWYPTVDAALTEASSEEALPPDPAR